MQSHAKNPHAVALGRKGGRATGGKRSPEQRRQAATKAVTARWSKHKLNQLPAAILATDQDQPTTQQSQQSDPGASLWFTTP